MLIVCPSCASEHTIDSALIGSDGRRVRCATCRNAWFVAPGQGEPAAADDPLEAGMGADSRSGAGGSAAQADTASSAPIEAAVAQKRGQAPKTPRRRPLRALATPFRALPSGAPTMLVGIAALASVILARATIVEAAPQTAGLYALIGLPVNLRGLDLAEVTSRIEAGAGDRLLVVEGEIVNVTRGEVAPRPLEFAVRTGDGRTLYTWTSEPPRKTLGPGEATPFRARLASPPAEGRQVLVRFASTAEGHAIAANAP